MAADAPFTQLNRILDSRHTQPGAIRKACLAVEDCLVNNRDNLRGFFDKCFPNLLKRIFGYDDFEASWLNMVTKAHKEDDARALVNLLHPQGKLFAAMHRADAESLIRYIFPVERLPGHTQALLSSAAGRKQLEGWPQYKGHIMGPEQSVARRTQVFLDVFTYYMLWTAFYVLRGSRAEEGGRGATFGSSASVYSAAGGGGSGGGFSPNQPWGLSELRRIGSTFIPGLGQTGGAPLSRHPYYTLMRLYLEHFLPVPPGAAGGTGGPPGGIGDPALGAGAGAARSTAGVSGPPTAGASSSGGARGMYGSIILNVMLEFWLTGVAEPVPSDADAAAGAGGGADKGIAGATTTAATGAPMAAGAASTAGASFRALSYQPPSEDLVEALINLVRYITVLEPSPRGTSAAWGRTGRLPAPGGGSGMASVSGKSIGATERLPAQSKQVWLPEVAVKTQPPLPSPRLLAAPSSPLLLNSPSAAPPVQLVSRKLYRLLRRTLTHWPLSSSASLTPVITLWLSIIAPWSPRLNAVAGAPAPQQQHTHSLLGLHPGARGHAQAGGLAFGASAGRHEGAAGGRTSGGYNSYVGHQPSSGMGSRTAAGAGGSPGSSAGQSSAAPMARYTPAWRQHVLSHLPFYTILIPRFLELTYARQSFRSDAALCDLLLLLEPLAASPELIKELQAAETAVHTYLAGGAGARRASETGGAYRELAAWAVEQACDWEAVAVAGVQLGAGGTQVDPAYRLFTADTRGAASYALAILRASEAQLVAPELRAAVREAAAAVLPLQGAEASLVRQDAAGAGAVGGLPPRPDLSFLRVGHWQELRYRGDPLRRPIASNEVGPLVRVLVHASDWLNCMLGLSQPLSPEEEAEPAESVGQQALRWLRRRHCRVNLRFLAEKQVLLWLLVLYALYHLFFAVPAGVYHASAPGILAPVPHAQDVPRPAAQTLQPLIPGHAEAGAL